MFTGSVASSFRYRFIAFWLLDCLTLFRHSCQQLFCCPTILAGLVRQHGPQWFFPQDRFRVICSVVGQNSSYGVCLPVELCLCDPILVTVQQATSEASSTHSRTDVTPISSLSSTSLSRWRALWNTSKLATPLPKDKDIISKKYSLTDQWEGDVVVWYLRA